MRYETIADATRAWQNEFNTFPYGMIEKLMTLDLDDWREVTPITTGDRVYSFEHSEYGEVIDVVDTDNGKLAVLSLDNGEEVDTDYDEMEKDDYSVLPMWGWLWQFNDSCDDWWLEKHLEEMAECGFRIYESDEFGYFFGIDGAGYDFYNAHWIPLYKVRGLKWHKEEE